ncbi:MotA/TolQ/ExbB proton channel family protein [Perlabentimonas gracilis]|uniref:MotA/TolQ/ExbB proton channel family protein n=1 Tax=Perlabentimonas gracilis TaxID=2715279 RepID=UPI00140DEEB2|nr:MotA/TolQ/ExbB proton channel family protein [Perlabentimonas gracilis]NHB67239.1 MotA/TolQ/ExbB proton channel family protein [Perlabentimonas gracilis]
MLTTHFMEGGPFGMTVIFGLWTAAIVLIGMLIYRWLNKAESRVKSSKALSESILFVGSFAFLFGIFYQALGMVQALNAIKAAGDISMALIAGGLRVSLIAPLYGLVLFLVSYIFWFINRRLSM